MMLLTLELFKMGTPFYRSVFFGCPAFDGERSL